MCMRRRLLKRAQSWYDTNSVLNRIVAALADKEKVDFETKKVVK